ncbi:MAG TPA: hypothetical protein PKX05_01285 [bacterium]|nr:hypothetical protein [bacterium]
MLTISDNYSTDGINVVYIGEYICWIAADKNGILDPQKFGGSDYVWIHNW